MRYDARGRLVIPRPEECEPDSDWSREAIPASSWFADMVWQMVRGIATAHDAAEDFGDFDLPALRARAVALVALIEAGPENVTYAGPPKLRVVQQ